MARDLIHQAVKNALTKDNWSITHDPYKLSYGGVDFTADLEAEKLIAATKDNQNIAVEVQSFLLQSSPISEFHTALGQFVNYRAVLEIKEPDRVLYMAIPDFADNTFFSLELPQLIVEENNLKLIIFEPEEEVIVKWIN